ncbi:MAG: hypothetical protein ACLQCB_06025 [Spirochaetia bacterium]
MKTVTEMVLDILKTLIPPVRFQEDRGKIHGEALRPLSLVRLRTARICVSDDDLGSAA